MIAGKIHYRQFGAPNAPLHPVGGSAVVDPWCDIFSRVTIAQHCDERRLRFGVGIQVFSKLASKGCALFDENLRQFRERVSPAKDDVCIARERYWRCLPQPRPPQPNPAMGPKLTTAIRSISLCSTTKSSSPCADEMRHRKPGIAQDKRKDGRYAGRALLALKVHSVAQMRTVGRPSWRVLDRNSRGGSGREVGAILLQGSFRFLFDV
jgi:hypothetical protein